MGYRPATITVCNNTAYRFVLINKRIKHGKITKQPAQKIPPKGNCTFKVDGKNFALRGPQGTLLYRYRDTRYNENVDVTVSWNHPFGHYPSKYQATSRPGRTGCTLSPLRPNGHKQTVHLTIAERSCLERYRPECWMQDLAETIADRPLCEIAMPGTHDTGTYATSPSTPLAPPYGKWDILRPIPGPLPPPFGALKGGWEIVRRVSSAYARTQRHDMARQLEDGMRYFDIRPCNTKKGWHTFHGITLGAELRGMLDATRDFIDRHDKEVVILHFRQFKNFDDQHEALLKYLLKLFDDKLVPALEGPRVTPDTLWQNGQQVIVRYNWSGLKPEYSDRIWPGPSSAEEKATEPWAGTTDLETFDRYMDKQLNERRWKLQAHKDVCEFFILQGVLTPDEAFIAKHPNKSLETELAAKVTSFVTYRLRDHWRHMGINIVTADFYDDAFVDTVIALN